MRKPNNWYQMDYYQQQEWRRAERDIESAEYDARMAREESEREQSRVRKQMNESRNEYQREIDDIQRELTCTKWKRNKLQKALELAREALEEWHDETTLPIVIEALEYNPQEDY
jgi:chromosome segregation ATPase